MATIQINPYVHRVAPGGTTVEHVLNAIYRALKTTTITHHWKIAEDDTGAELLIGDPVSTVLNTGLRALVLEGKGGSVAQKRLLLRRFSNGTGNAFHHLIASYHSSQAFETKTELESFFGNSSTYQVTKTLINEDATTTPKNWYDAASGLTNQNSYLVSSPELFIGLVETGNALNSTTFGISTQKLDIIQTEDSLTLAFYDSVARTLWGVTAPVHTSWQRILHVGEIFTPDNRSDPELKITSREEFTGHGIMAGYYGFDQRSVWMIPSAPLSSTAVTAKKQSYAEVGKIDISNNSVWKLAGFVPAYCWGHNTNTTPTVVIRPQFGFIGDESDNNRGERIIPYRIKTFGSNNSLITRFIKQRAFGIGEIDLELNTIIPGKFVNSRYPSSPVSWLHQCLLSYGSGANLLNNTVHVWCKDGDTSTSNFLQVT